MSVIRVERLIWDEWNIEHIARHGVVKRQVEEVFRGFYVARESYGSRYLILGQTEVGHVLAVIIHPKGQGAYYVVTARPADRKERKIYQAEVEAKFQEGGEDAA